EGAYLDRDVDLGPGTKPWRTGLKIVHPDFRVDGRWPDEARVDGPTEVLVGAVLARSLGLATGASVAIEIGGAGLDAVVPGVLTSGGPEDGGVFAPLEPVARLAGRPGGADRVEVLAITTPEDDLARRVRKDPASLTPEDAERFSCTPYPGAVAKQCGQAW